MVLTFHPLTAYDLSELRSWFADAELFRRISYPTDEWFRYVTTGDHARCWIAYREGRAVAQVQVDQDGTEPGYLDIALRPDLRRQGLGRAVLAAFVEGPGSAYPGLEGRIEPDNDASLACCRACGFGLSDDLDEDGLVRAVHPGPAA